MKHYTCLSATPEPTTDLAARMVQRFSNRFPTITAVWEEVESWRPFAIETANRYKPWDLEPEDAAGIGIEVLVEALEDWDPTLSNLGTWSKTKIRSRMKNLRVKKRLLVEPLVVRSFEDDAEQDRDIPTPEPEEAAEADDRGRLAFRLLDSLPAAQSKALKLKHGLSDEGPQTYAQIGEKLGGVTKQRAEQLVKQALVALRQKLSEAENSL